MASNFRWWKPQTFDSTKDIPRLTGKVILVTGANAGLGRQAVLDYAKHSPSAIWLACRDAEKGGAAAAEIKQQVPEACIKILKLDLTSLASVREAASTFLSESNRLDILMLNAGIMATPPGLTNDGYEIQFGTNHMGHALLARLLLPVLKKTAEENKDDKVRIVSVASHGHIYYEKRGFRYETLKTNGEALSTYQRYFQSKLANVLWARRMAQLYPQFVVASVDPGMVQTQLIERATATPAIVRFLVKYSGPLKSTPERGVLNQLWASVSPDVKSGEYYEPVGVENRASEYGKDDSLAEAVWEWTERELDAFLAQ
jgi:retinol dehydrogenase 12